MSYHKRSTSLRRGGFPPATDEASTPRGGHRSEVSRRQQDMLSQGRPSLTPSSSSMMSLPMEASVVHLQLLVALTAQRL